MGACPNCPCDYCYFEFNPMYGPARPPECNDCRTRIPFFTFLCAECTQVRRQEWLDDLRRYREYLSGDSKVVSREDHERMMREAQE